MVLADWASGRDGEPEGTTRVSLKRSALKRRIEEELLKQEARRRQCSVVELVQDEILGQVATPTEEEVSLAAGPGTCLDDVRESLRQERIRERRRWFLKQLRKRAAETS